MIATPPEVRGAGPGLVISPRIWGSDRQSTVTFTALPGWSECGDRAGEHVWIVDGGPRLGSGHRNQLGVGKVRRESLCVGEREEIARVAPDQQDRPIKARNHLCGID